MNLEGYLKKIPEFKGANWLIRTPLAIVFILQGLQKLPLNIEDAESFEDLVKEFEEGDKLAIVGRRNNNRFFVAVTVD